MGCRRFYRMIVIAEINNRMEHYKTFAKSINIEDTTDIILLLDGQKQLHEIMNDFDEDVDQLFILGNMDDDFNINGDTERLNKMLKRLDNKYIAKLKSLKATPRKREKNIDFEENSDYKNDKEKFEELKEEIIFCDNLHPKEGATIASLLKFGYHLEEDEVYNDEISNKFSDLLDKIDLTDLSQNLREKYERLVADIEEQYQVACAENVKFINLRLEYEALAKKTCNGYQDKLNNLTIKIEKYQDWVKNVKTTHVEHFWHNETLIEIWRSQNHILVETRNFILNMEIESESVEAIFNDLSRRTEILQTIVDLIRRKRDIKKEIDRIQAILWRLNPRIGTFISQQDEELRELKIKIKKLVDEKSFDTAWEYASKLKKKN